MRLRRREKKKNVGRKHDEPNTDKMKIINIIC